MNEKLNGELQVSNLVDTTKPRAILADAKRFYKLNYPKSDFGIVDKAFILTKRLFDGRFPGYLACAVEYHTHSHSVSVFAAVSRLLDGCELSGLAIGPERAAETLVAALLHDVGYIREEGDDKGSGAQYTRVHVARSAAFARRRALAFGLSDTAAERVARMILATEVSGESVDLAFADEGEHLGAKVLAAADLLGQMADRAYLEKLLFLYYEFSEAGISGYDTAFDVLKKTAAFYESTKDRLDGKLGRVSGKARMHFRARYGVDRDLYREAIERQMTYLESIIADDKTNFRAKLKRMDLAAIESRRA
jgi:HD domain